MKKLKPEEFFGLYNYRVVSKCCRNCKHAWYRETTLGKNSNLKRTCMFCNHPAIIQPKYPGPIAEFDICDAWEKSC